MSRRWPEGEKGWAALAADVQWTEDGARELVPAAQWPDEPPMTAEEEESAGYLPALTQGELF